jgi:hypothetical protein
MRTTLALTVLLAAAAAGGQEPPFKGGFPPPDAAQKARDDADFQRAVTAYRFWYPTVSAEGVFHGRRAAGAKDNQTMTVLLAGPRHLILTANSDTPYGSGLLDLSAGPVVVELPPGRFVGVAVDRHQRWVADLGLSGPDAGKGGKHLLLPPDYKGKPPDGYHVSRSSSFGVMLAVRALPDDRGAAGAMDALRALKLYPLAAAADPAPTKFVDATDKSVDLSPLRWEDALVYWEKLHTVIDAEPVVPEYRAMYGLLAAVGIEKGRPFAPDARLKDILTRAAKAGRDQMLVAAFASTRPDRLVWKDRRWEWAGLVADNGGFETPTGIDLEARDRWFAQAILASPKMFLRTPGAGSLYWLGVRDAGGAYLDGGKTYKLTVPQPVPAKLFWSVTVYDVATRSQVQTAQDRAALRSLFELKDAGGEKALDLYFGPKAPPGQEGRWVQTAPGKGWFAYLRLFGPDGPAFDGSWKPGDFEEVK